MIRYIKAEPRRLVFLRCKEGHLLEGDNVYLSPTNGAQVCRKCKRAYQREWLRRKKALNRKHRQVPQIGVQRQEEEQKVA